MPRITVRLDQDTIDRLQDIAQQLNTTKSKATGATLRLYFERKYIGTADQAPPTPAAPISPA